MQSTGHTSTHERSLTLMHGSAMTYGIHSPPRRVTNAKAKPTSRRDTFEPPHQAKQLLKILTSIPTACFSRLKLASSVPKRILDTRGNHSRAPEERNPGLARRGRPPAVCRAWARARHVG